MKRLTYNIIIKIAIPALLFSSCETLEPDVSNVYTLDDVKNFTNYAEGILLKAYRDLPTNHSNFNLAYGSDDAVTNNQQANVKNANDGGWTSSTNPFSVWNNSYESILYINTFLEEMTDIDWYWEFENVSKMFAKRLRGEAFGLRAWYYFGLLQAHAGKGKNGEMLGVPIVDHVLDPGNPDDYEIPRSSFNDLVKFIITDCDSAIALLPDRYIDSGDSYYKLGYGDKFTNRINGLAVRLIKTKALLYAASPAYSEGSNYTYQQAAESAVEIMDLNGGLSDVDIDNQNYLKFYGDNAVSQGNAHPEVFWYSSRRNINSWEQNNFSPSWYGTGTTNPTQELVNAFPLVTGIPFDPSLVPPGSNPYEGRDPRLAMNVLYNGQKVQRGDSLYTVNTFAGSQDAIGSSDPYRSLTGYYLKKFMNMGVNVDPAVNSQGIHYYVYARYTDVLLMFAEAANEAAGPDGDIGGYNARQVINAIRDRGGITAQFWVSIQDQVGLRELIRNERRLEMCFENQRFWDLRRWEMTDVMKEPVHGVQVSADGTVFNYVEVEKRNYKDYQIYGPIPFGETLKYELVQNEGWN